MAANKRIQFQEDKDSIHRLPLQIIPLQTQGLADATITKNLHLESVVELFADKGTGRGQVYPRQLSNVYDFTGERENDRRVILALGDLPSFDVYSLRIALRELGVDVDEEEHLRLSEEMELALSGFMKSFTKPLIAAVYGNEATPTQNFSDIVRLFLDPNVAKARDNLTALAFKLKVDLPSIPRFLAHYADVYLSLAYYRYCLDEIRPSMQEFLEAVDDLRRSPRHQYNKTLMDACTLIEDRLTGAELSISRILEIFQIQTEDMWKNVSAKRFKGMERMIQYYQQEIGGSICALTVKMKSWDALDGKWNPSTQEVFIMSDMLKGIDSVTHVEFQEMQA